MEVESDLPDRLGFAVVGCGNMGMKRIKSILENQNRCQLVCIADMDVEKAKSVAKDFGCEYYTEYMNVVGNPDVECVVVSTPNKFHAPVSIAALKHGKHVLCEKPLARNPKEAIAMVKAALKNHTFLKTGSNVRFFPSVLKAKELQDKGEIGTVLFLRGWIGNSGWHLKNLWFTDPDMAGGGTFLDNGTHMLDLVRCFLGEVSECLGFASTMFWSVKPLEDIALGVFKTLNGKLAFIQSSWFEWAGYIYMEVYGTDGYIRIDNRDQTCKTILGKKDGSKRIFDYSLQPPVSYNLELKHLIESIQGAKQPLPSGYDGLRAVQMAWGVYESSRTGKKVTIYKEQEKALNQKHASIFSKN